MACRRRRLRLEMFLIPLVIIVTINTIRLYWLPPHNDNAARNGHRKGAVQHLKVSGQIWVNHAQDDGILVPHDAHDQENENINDIDDSDGANSNDVPEAAGEDVDGPEAGDDDSVDSEIYDREIIDDPVNAYEKIIPKHGINNRIELVAVPLNKNEKKEATVKVKHQTLIEHTRYYGSEDRVSGISAKTGEPHMHSCDVIVEEWPASFPPIMKPGNYTQQKVPPLFLDPNAVNNANILDNINYIIMPTSQCQGEHIVVICTSAIKSFRLRNAIRTTWGDPQQVNLQTIYTLNVVFIIGDDKMMLIEDRVKLQTEAEKYNDMVQLDVPDGYQNLTLKRLIGVRWAVTHCPQAQYFLYATDDIVINPVKLANIITHSPKTGLYLGCKYPQAQKAIATGKYAFHSSPAIDWVQYNLLPDYHIGFGVLLSRDVASHINGLACMTPLVFPDDVYLGLLMRMLGIGPRGQYDLCGIRHTRDRQRGTQYTIDKFGHRLWSDKRKAFIIHLYDRHNSDQLIRGVWNKHHINV